jgi:uncharacterized FAD-dependent dehydrogenase
VQKEIVLELSPEDASHEAYYKPFIIKKLKIAAGRIQYIKIIRKSIDARSRKIRVNIAFQVFIDEKPSAEINWHPSFQNVDKSREVLVIGAGPAGMFAALRLLEVGIRPVILERGKPVEERIDDIRLLEYNHQLNPDSNYCFGEGGAGTLVKYIPAPKRGVITIRSLKYFIIMVRMKPSFMKHTRTSGLTGCPGLWPESARPFLMQEEGYFLTPGSQILLLRMKE